MIKLKSSQEQTKYNTQTEKMVACSQCGIHIPEKESSIRNGQVCCQTPECNK